MPFKDKEEKKQYQRGYYQRNKKRLDQRNKEYRLNHGEKCNGYCRKYRRNNKEKRRKVCMNWVKNNPKKRRKIENRYRKNRWKRDNEFNIKTKLRNRLDYVLREYTKTGKIMPSRRYGVNFKAIIEHLKPFPKDLKDFEIDHIRPLCSFDLTDPEQVKQAFSPQNHQWLTAKDNLQKGGKWDGK